MMPPSAHHADGGCLAASDIVLKYQFLAESVGTWYFLFSAYFRKEL